MMKTYILVRPNFMADYILEAFRDDERYIVVHHERKHGLLSTIKRFIRFKLSGSRKGLWSESFFSREYLELLHSVTPADRVLLWAIGNLKDTSLIAEEVNTKNITSLIWDPMRQICHDSARQKREYMPKMRELGVRAITFDAGDAEKYGMQFCGQIYRYPDLPMDSVACSQSDSAADRQSGVSDNNAGVENSVRKSEVFFVGADKRRGEAVSKLVEQLEREGIDYHFALLPDKTDTFKNYPNLQRSIIAKGMPYSETLSNIRSSRCLVELLQPGQTGLTIRSLEALFFGKKLITDNQHIKAEAFYTPDNVYIIGEESQPWKSLREFLDAPYMAAEERAIIDHYDIKSRINTFFE